MHSPWHLKKKKKMFSPTPHNARIQKGFIPYEKFTPQPPQNIYIYIYIQIFILGRSEVVGRGGGGGDLCSPWYWELFASSLFWLPTIWSRRTSIVAITFLLLLLFIYLKKESSLKTKVKNINLGNYQSACISRLLSIFPQAQYALHTNQYQRPHHRQHARSHLQALPSA